MVAQCRKSSHYRYNIQIYFTFPPIEIVMTRHYYNVRKYSTTILSTTIRQCFVMMSENIPTVYGITSLNHIFTWREGMLSLSNFFVPHYCSVMISENIPTLHLRDHESLGPLSASPISASLVFKMTWM